MLLKVIINGLGNFTRRYGLFNREIELIHFRTLIRVQSFYHVHFVMCLSYQTRTPLHGLEGVYNSNLNEINRFGLVLFDPFAVSREILRCAQDDGLLSVLDEADGEAVATVAFSFDHPRIIREGQMIGVRGGRIRSVIASEMGKDSTDSPDTGFRKEDS